MSEIPWVRQVSALGDLSRFGQFTSLCTCLLCAEMSILSQANSRVPQALMSSGLTLLSPEHVHWTQKVPVMMAAQPSALACRFVLTLCILQAPWPLVLLHMRLMHISGTLRRKGSLYKAWPCGGLHAAPACPSLILLFSARCVLESSYFKVTTSSSESFLMLLT